MTTNSHSRLVVVNSNHPSLPPALIRILCHQKLTTDLRFPAICRQSNVFFAENAPIKIKVRNKITYFHSVFLLPRPHLALSLGHLALIYPAAAGKLTTKPRDRAFRRHFLLLFSERANIRGLSGILVRGVCEMSHSNYSIPSAFEAQARLIRNSLRLRRSGSLSRSPSAISSYIPFGIGTVPREPLEFTTTNRDSPSSSK